MLEMSASTTSTSQATVGGHAEALRGGGGNLVVDYLNDLVSAKLYATPAAARNAGTAVPAPPLMDRALCCN